MKNNIPSGQFRSSDTNIFLVPYIKNCPVLICDIYISAYIYHDVTYTAIPKSMNYFPDRQSICQRVLLTGWRSVAVIMSSRSRGETSDEKFTNWRETGAKWIDTHGTQQKFSNSRRDELIRIPRPAPTENSATSAVAAATAASVRPQWHRGEYRIRNSCERIISASLFLAAAVSSVSRNNIGALAFTCIVYSTDFLISAVHQVHHLVAFRVNSARNFPARSDSAEQPDDPTSVQIASVGKSFLYFLRNLGAASKGNHVEDREKLRNKEVSFFS